MTIASLMAARADSDLADIVIQTPVDGEVDRYGNPVGAYDAGTVVAAWVSPATVDENTVDRDTRLIEQEVVLPPGTVVSALSRITYEGKEYEVIGDPRTAPTPLGAHHVELVMRRTEG